MEKQVFIPKTILNETLGLDCSDKTRLNYLAWLGIVNQELCNKANAKEITNIELHQKFEDGDTMFLGDNPVWENCKPGYLVTYLESDMIASRCDLERAWDYGEDEGRASEQAKAESSVRDYRSFCNWFEHIFNSN